MKKKLKYLGRFLGLRVWEGSVFNGKAYVIEILSEFVFRSDFLCDYAVLELENFTCKRGSRLLSIRTEALSDKGWTLDALMEHLKTTEPHWFPDFPTKCRNCKCLHYRKGDGFIGCTCSQHVNWDCNLSTDYGNKFRNVNEVVDSSECDPSAITQWSVWYDEDCRRSSLRRKAKEEADIESKKRHARALEDFDKFIAKYKEHDLNRIAAAVFAGRSTHCDRAEVRLKDDRIEVGFDCGWLNRGITMEALIEEAIKELKSDGITATPNPIAWYAWNYGTPGASGNNHEYVWFIVKAF